MSTERPSYRQRQAAATRARVARAARRVFASRGYGAATIADVAQAAGVAVPTVYKLYGSKPRLLSAVIETWRGEFVPESLELIPSDPRAALGYWARTIRRQWETGLDIAMIFAGAVASELDARAELQSRLKGREVWVVRVADVIKPTLVPGRTVEEAAGIISALSLPEIYRELVEFRGWTPDEFESWLTQTLTEQLLGHSSAVARPPHA